MVDGFCYVDRLIWDNYNESADGAFWYQGIEDLVWLPDFPRQVS